MTKSDYDIWFAAKVAEALADDRPPIPHHIVMEEVQRLIDRKREEKRAEKNPS
ncbi:hypothetical protein GJW-30_1_02872 [Variibacter gotjawalensis]|uniref:Stability determinant domain-containing protein n=1 Tax=Variibacter gotjawalensis TaxID=1333996 RepID=A0A0S3PX23_9BRAD|nr:hypothetical protein [Variibacter gotjawalensis]NIK46162.1 hypothetical protein [Variibacter gotjawalensis]BAT60336.1 hypothetical protein GJW-30_1_02872 [Variibacter gotjawalensis]